MGDEHTKQRLQRLHSLERGQDPHAAAARQADRDAAKRAKLEAALAAEFTLHRMASFPRASVATATKSTGRAYTPSTYADLQRDTPAVRVLRHDGAGLGDPAGGWDCDEDRPAAGQRHAPLVDAHQLRFLTWNSRALEYADKALEQAGAEYEASVFALAEQEARTEAGACPAFAVASSQCVLSCRGLRVFRALVAARRDECPRSAGRWRAARHS
jgi:hypothetical protein